MGFWQGMNEGLTYVLEKRAREKELADAKAERQYERDLAKKQREEDRAHDYWMFQQKIIEERRGSLWEEIKKRNSSPDVAAQVQHNLSVLKSFGASDEVIAKAAAYGPEALAEAVSVIQKRREKYAGSPIEFGPAQVDAILGSAISTVVPGKTPDIRAAAALYGFDPDKLDEPVPSFGGMTAREALGRGLTTPPGRMTTIIDQPQGKPLDTADIKNIQDSASKNLLDSLTERVLSESQEAAAILEKERTGIRLSEDEVRRKEILNQSLLQLKEAEEALKAGAPSKAIGLVGGQAIMPFLANNPAAVQYTFGGGWMEAIRSYTFNDEQELMQAEEDGKVRLGDIVIVGGQVGVVR